ncbi:MAG: hypothetical protein MUE44_21375 [Oscillatoriaceae cyanobacterium Prado104]|jgi:phage/plasmid-associated DNA primase|nr:hypothetical protein [Oscillatoriaceae cyanobacterium Prado104]
MISHFNTSRSVSPVPQQNLTTNGFQKVSKANPCPLCGKPDWCKVAPDDTVMCPRTDSAPIGWKRIKTNAGGGGIFKPESTLTDRATTVTRAPKKQPVSKQFVSKPAPVPEGVELLRLPAPAVDCPQPQKPTFLPKGVPNHATQTIYSYNKDKTQLVYRFEWADATKPKGRDKTYRQSHVEGGETVWTKGEGYWGMYRGLEVFSIATDQPKGQPFGLLILEGEPNVELARSIGLAAITFQGSNWNESEMETELAFYGIFQKHGGVPVILQMRDNDDEGIKKAEKVRAVCAKLGIPYVLINPVEIYPEIPHKGDIKEILDVMEPLEFIRRLEEQIHAVASGVETDSPPIDSATRKRDKQPLPQELGSEFAEDLRDRLCYSDSHKSWMKYELDRAGVWAEVGDDYVLSAIDTMCRTRGVQPNNSYCANVLGTLKRQLFELKWLESPSNELMPFEDGVLEVEGGQWHEHAPGFRLTWSLPRSHKGNAVNTGWSRIETYLSQATEGSERKKNILLAFAAAALRGLSELHKFLMLTGPGGTGKGIFTRLLTMVVGERNTWIGNLEDLTKDPKVAELQTKRLAVFDDQEKYVGNLSNFRSMTGGGLLSGRPLYKSPIKFRFPGLALVTANQPCFPASGLSWLKRRILQEEFRFSPHKRNTKLERELELEMSAFTQYLLSIPVAEIENTLNPESDQINLTFWQDRVRADPLAAWLDECLIYDPASQTTIGADKERDGTLFGNYNLYCRANNYSPKGKQNFSADLEEMCRSVLGWKGVEKKKTEAGMAILGLKLRKTFDTAPTAEEMISSKDADLNLQDADLAADLKPLQCKHPADPADLIPKISAEVQIENSSPPLDSIDSESSAGESLPAQVCRVCRNDTEQGFQSSEGVQPETETVSDIKVGDRVEVVGSTIGHYNGVKGEVIGEWYTNKGKEYTVQFDTPIGNADCCDFPACELRKLE